MLNVKSLKAGYKNTVVVDIPSLVLKNKEHLLIVGKSGSGKTTLLYALAGLLKPISGKIEIDNTNTSSLTSSKMDEFRGKNIGIIYQTLQLISSLSVLENILLVQYANGTKQDSSRAKELLKHLGLSEFRNKKPDELSQGQQQRVAIARAVINNPKIIFGDEPTSALDDESAEKVINLLLGIANQTGASLVLATHDSRIKKYFNNIINLGGKDE
ncbi:MAG: ABC transporter ATP-binding protein [Alphaproteobacteria bacterium]|jgi:ABC-type lipoprotein export system ATPase subunit